ncbi:MAG: XkdF-like putative serine protease domain-containing protein [Acidimicrobiales bacterium]
MSGVGAVLKSNEESRYLLTVAYAPRSGKLPGRGLDGKLDVASPEVLEKAAWRFALNGFRVGLNHEKGHEGCARVVESWIHRGGPWKITAADGSTQVIKKGTWLVGMILDKPTWALYKQGRIGGASPQGTAHRKPASPKTLRKIGR